ncbi:toxic anion resistance protein [Staphylococcus phage vB_StaM_SA1]|nr:toxic anion resistance protein [Staphylococcus phage vB_StaM_SA1]
MENNKNELIKRENIAPEIFKKANSIDILDKKSIIEYGHEVQDKLSKESDKVLRNIKENDSNDKINKVLNDMLEVFKSYDPQNVSDEVNKEVDQGFMDKIKSMFNKSKENLIGKELSKVDSATNNMTFIEKQLNESSSSVDIMNKNLDDLIKSNKEYYENLNQFIEAAKYKQLDLKDEITKDVESVKEIEDAYEKQNQIQLVSDKEQGLDNLDKRIYDLSTSLALAEQNVFELEMIKNINLSLKENINNSLVNSIPIWKSQLTKAVVLIQQQQSIKTSKAIREATSDILISNSNILKDNAVQMYNESNRSFIDIDVLKETQRNMIEMTEDLKRMSEEAYNERLRGYEELKEIKEEKKELDTKVEI